jgi:urease accessory protein
VHQPAPEIVFLNTAGGLTGGDRLVYEGALSASARATFTTQTAERAYRSSGAAARMEVRLSAGPAARLDWLPQETILFEGSALHRETAITLGAGAECLMVETVVLGRAAMGETLRRLNLRDRRVILREGRPVFIDPLALGDGDLTGQSAAGLCGARALSTLVFVAQGAEDALAPLRAELAEDGVEAAASAWDGRLVLRARAADALPLRRLVARLLVRLRTAPVPRVWQI